MMKNTFSILFLLLSILAFPQDLDFDGRKDFVQIDSVKSVIVCKLSSQNFRKIESKPIETYGDKSGIRNTKNGFEFFVNWMRAGYACQFRYDKTSKKIQLIGMSRYEFGPANNDGSGESSVNLLTRNYIGEWNYWDENQLQLKKIPILKTKMKFGKIYLEDFSEDIFTQFQEQCSALYYKHKKLAKSKKSNRQ